MSLFILLLGYLFGSFPSGFIAGRIIKGIDIRAVGSGSTGATNVHAVVITSSPSETPTAARAE